MLYTQQPGEHYRQRPGRGVLNRDDPDLSRGVGGVAIELGDDSFELLSLGLGRSQEDGVGGLFRLDEDFLIPARLGGRHHFSERGDERFGAGLG